MSQCTIDAEGNRKWLDAAGDLHREDGPAVEWANGSKEWWLNGLRHREGGPAMELADGTKVWYRNNLIHREDGPAIGEANGDKQWYLNGQRHREDGPAVERVIGATEWWIADLRITQAQFDTLSRDAEGHLHSGTGPLIEVKEGRHWFWHGEHVTEQAFEALCTAQRVKQGLGNAMESQAPQRPRRRPVEHQRGI